MAVNLCETCEIRTACADKNSLEQSVRALGLVRRVVITENELESQGGLSVQSARAVKACLKAELARECGFYEEENYN